MTLGQLGTYATAFRHEAAFFLYSSAIGKCSSGVVGMPTTSTFAVTGLGDWGNA